MFDFVKTSVNLLKRTILQNYLQMDLKNLRIEYETKRNVFTESSIKIKNPVELFKEWFQEALSNPNVIEGNAMCLSTCTKNGYPSARYVLCKEFDSDGFKFFTNLNSRKAKEMNENPKAALTFYWNVLHRQVRIEGNIEVVSNSEAVEYFASRPKQSQVSAIISNQSSAVPSREYLESKVAAFNDQNADSSEKPDHWGGFLLRPNTFEFWQGQRDRLHDRIRFRKLATPDETVDELLLHRGENGWFYERLAP